MNKQEWDALKEGDYIISKDNQGYVFEWDLKDGKTLCVDKDGLPVALSSLDYECWKLLAPDTIDPNDRGRRLQLRQWIIAPVYEGTLEHRKGYEYLLRVADDPKFIEYFKSIESLNDRVDSLEDEAYAELYKNQDRR